MKWFKPVQSTRQSCFFLTTALLDSQHNNELFFLREFPNIQQKRRVNDTKLR